MLFRNLIYILQLNLYDTKSFLCFAYTHLTWWKLEKRAMLVWTKKVQLIYAMSSVAVVAVAAVSFWIFGMSGLVAVFFEIICLPLFIALANVLINPLDQYLKKRLIVHAKNILRKYENVTVIGITGSYGKTSAREILATILSDKFSVFKMADNINTDVGIADFIVKNPNFLEGKNIFIVEMGAYQRGEIKKLCDLADPDYAILTGINESHLERFGSLKNIIQTKFELPVSAKKMSVLNIDDENVRDNYERFKIENPVSVSRSEADDIRALENFSGLGFALDGSTFKTKLLAKHNVSLIILASKIAEALGMTREEVAAAVSKIEYIPHRLEPIHNEKTNVWVIDDSYNGNFDGIVSGLEVLSRARGRKLVLTPGLVELGEKTKKVHNEIGRLYAKSGIDLVILIKSLATPHLVFGMEENGFSKYEIFNSTQEAHAALPCIIKSGDTIIFQNDLPDNYF